MDARKALFPFCEFQCHMTNAHTKSTLQEKLLLLALQTELRHKENKTKTQLV